jgi:dUTP pyrophosphatase
MNNIEVKFVKTHESAVLPIRKHDNPLTGDSGYDLTAVEDCVIPARSGTVVPVGLKLGYITPGYWIRIESRSGLQFKHNISAFNGIIDSQYRGDLGAKINNNSDIDYHVKRGDRIAQLVIYPLISSVSSWIETAEETTRGENGFGSTGK